MAKSIEGSFGFNELENLLKGKMNEAENIDVTVDINANDNASKPIQNIGKETKDLEGKLEHVSQVSQKSTKKVKDDVAKAKKELTDLIARIQRAETDFSAREVKLNEKQIKKIYSNIRTIKKNNEKFPKGTNQYLMEGLVHYAQESVIDSDLFVVRKPDKKKTIEQNKKIVPNPKYLQVEEQQIEEQAVIRKDTTKKLQQENDAITEIVRAYKKNKDANTYKKGGKNGEYSALYKSGKKVGEIAYSDKDQSGHVQIPQGEGNGVIHTHPYSSTRDHLNLSMDDIEKIVSQKYDEAILVCGDEILKMDFSNIAKEDRDAFKDLVNQIYYAAYAQVGIQVDKNGKLVNIGNITDEQQTKFAEIVNNKLGEALEQQGGKLTFQKSTDKGFVDNTRNRLKGLSEADETKYAYLHELTGVRDFKGIREAQQAFGLLTETVNETSDAIDKVVKSEEKMSKSGSGGLKNKKKEQQEYRKEVEATNEAIEDELDALANYDKKADDSTSNIRNQVNDFVQELENREYGKGKKISKTQEEEYKRAKYNISDHIKTWDASEPVVFSSGFSSAAKDTEKYLHTVAKLNAYQKLLRSDAKGIATDLELGVIDEERAEKELLVLRSIDETIKRRRELLKEDKETTERIKQMAHDAVDNKTSLVSPSQTFDNEIQKNVVYLENYQNTIKEINRLKLEPETEETRNKLEELNKLADYFVSNITEIRSENGHHISPEMMEFGGMLAPSLRKYSSDQVKGFKQAAHDNYGLDVNKPISEYSYIADELKRIENQSESTRQSLAKGFVESKKYAQDLYAALETIVDTREELAKGYLNEKSAALYQKDVDELSKQYPEILELAEKFKNYDDVFNFKQSGGWNDFLATLPKAHEYLESIGYDFQKIEQQSNENNLSLDNLPVEQQAQKISEAIKELESVTGKSLAEIVNFWNELDSQTKTSASEILAKVGLVNEQQELLFKIAGEGSNTKGKNGIAILTDQFAILQKQTDLTGDELQDYLRIIQELQKAGVNVASVYSAFNSSIGGESKKGNFTPGYEIQERLKGNIVGTPVRRSSDENSDTAKKRIEELTRVLSLSDEQILKFVNDFSQVSKVLSSDPSNSGNFVLSNTGISMIDMGYVRGKNPNSVGTKDILAGVFGSLLNAKGLYKALEVSPEVKDAVNQVSLRIAKVIEESGIATRDEILDQIKSITGENGYNYVKNNLINETPVSNQAVEAEEKLLPAIVENNEELQKRKAIEDELFRKDIGQDREAEERREITDILKKQTEEQEKLNAVKKEEVSSPTSVGESAKASADAEAKEAEKFEEIQTEAKGASEAKEGFAKANAEVLKSIVDSLSGLDNEGNAFKSISKLLKDFSGDKSADKVQTLVSNITALKTALDVPVQSGGFITALQKLADKGESLSNLATVLKASKKQIETAESATQFNATKEQKASYSEELKIQKEIYSLNQQIELSKIKGSKDASEIEIRNTKEVASLQTKINQIKAERYAKGLNNKELEEYNTKQLNEIKRSNDVILDSEREIAEQHKKAAEAAEEKQRAEREAAKIAKEAAEQEAIAQREATEQNEKATKAYKELTSDASEYWKLKIRLASEDITGNEKERLKELEESWEKATRGVEEYQKAAKGAGTSESEDKYWKASRDFNRSKWDIGIKYSQDLQKTSDKLRVIAESKKYTEELTNEAKELAEIINKINSDPIDLTDEKTIKYLENLKKQASGVFDKSKIAEFKAASADSIAKLNLKIEDFIHKNSKMGRSLQEEFKKLKIDWDAATSIEELKRINTEFVKLEARVTELNRTGLSFFDKVKARASELSAKYIAQYFSFQDIIRYGRQAFETIRDLDTQLVDLRKTTSMNAQELENFYQKSTQVGKALGVTTSEIISQAAAWSRLGYSTNEEATKMAELSSKFTSISPGMNTEQATDGLVSAMKGFGIAVDDVERSIMDNINRIGNTMATSNAEVVEMLERSSAAMKAANNSIEETIALESAAVQITRNAETTGTAFRTISMRIRGKQSLPPYTVMYMLCA